MFFKKKSIQKHNRVIPPEESEYICNLLDELDTFTETTCGISKKIFKKNNNILTCDNEEDIQHKINTIRKKIRNKWHQNKQIIDLFLINKNNSLSENDKYFILSLKHCINDTFLYIKEYNNFAIFFSIDTIQYYAVKSLEDDFEEILPFNKPCLLKTMLLPYKNFIVWDGIIAIAKIDISPETVNDFYYSATKAYAEGKIIQKITPT